MLTIHLFHGSCIVVSSNYTYLIIVVDQVPMLSLLNSKFEKIFAKQKGYQRIRVSWIPYLYLEFAIRSQGVHNIFFKNVIVLHYF
jgi:hypothetical protein